MKQKLAAVAVFFMAGCSAQPHFQPLGNGVLALDTKTGQRCITMPKPDAVDKYLASKQQSGDPFAGLDGTVQNAKSDDVWAEFRNPSPIPYCVDLK
jgi:hypothetical protein